MVDQKMQLDNHFAPETTGYEKFFLYLTPLSGI